LPTKPIATDSGHSSASMAKLLNCSSAAYSEYSTYQRLNPVEKKEDRLSWTALISAGEKRRTVAMAASMCSRVSFALGDDMYLSSRHLR
jgi:hypothetical protein